jgi:hypothetical protein
MNLCSNDVAKQFCISGDQTVKHIFKILLLAVVAVFLATTVQTASAAQPASVKHHRHHGRKGHRAHAATHHRAGQHSTTRTQ